MKEGIRPYIQDVESVSQTDRGLEEYLSSLELSPEDLRNRTILDVGGGTRRFLKEAKQIDSESNIITVDPFYALPPNERIERIRGRFERFIENISRIENPSLSLLRNVAAAGYPALDEEDQPAANWREVLAQYYTEKAEQSYLDSTDPDLNEHTVAGSAESLPFSTESFDLLLANYSVTMNSHLSSEKEEVFREFHRVLRSGGQVRIMPIEGLWSWEAGELESIVSKLGFTIKPSQDEYLLILEK